MKRKRHRQRRANPKRMIASIDQTFNSILTKPALKSTILTLIAIVLSKTFTINEISRRLPVAVKTEKTKQKRFLRFLDRKYPKKAIMERWLTFVLERVYQTSGEMVSILIDETDLIGPFKAIVAAVPFRQRAIVIYFKVYLNFEIRSMKYKSHNTLVQKFCWRVYKIATSTLPKRSKPLLIFDRGFARARYLMKWFQKKKIRFLIRVCKNTGLEIYGQATTLKALSRCGFFANVVYHRTERLNLNLYVVRDDRFDDPMYLVTDCICGVKMHHYYKRRMQIEHGFRDLKTLFGFRQLRLIKETKKRVELLWLLLCLADGLALLLYEKSAYRWSKTYNSTQKTKSLTWIIKEELSKRWRDFELQPFFTLPLLEGDIY